MLAQVDAEIWRTMLALGQGVLVALVVLIYKNIMHKLNELTQGKVDKAVCEVVRESEQKDLNYIMTQLEKLWNEIRDTREAIIKEVKKNGNGH
jgi:hypothetical protein